MRPASTTNDGPLIPLLIISGEDCRIMPRLPGMRLGVELISTIDVLQLVIGDLTILGATTAFSALGLIIPLDFLPLLSSRVEWPLLP